MRRAVRALPGTALPAADRRGRRGRRVVVVGALSLALLVAGCTLTDEAPDVGTAPAATPGDALPSDSSTGVAVPSLEPSATAAGEPVDVSGLGLVDRHPNGTVLEVTSVAAGPDAVVVGVTVTNGYSEAIRLNSRGVFLLDDLGNGYPLQPPELNERLRVPAGQRLSGELVFPGEVDPRATSLTLKTNVYNADDTVDTTSRSAEVTTPVLLVPDLPVG